MAIGRDDVVAIVVGTDPWNETTRPFVESLRQHDRDLRVVVVDNSAGYYPSIEHEYDVVRLPRLVSYAQALNVGLAASYPANWYVCFNNDCLAHGSVRDALKDHDPYLLWGSAWWKDEPSNHIISGDLDFVPTYSAWLAISNLLHSKVGMFDPALYAFEDFDYEIRAQRAGFGIGVIDLPVRHLDKHTRLSTREYNIKWEESRQLYSFKHNVRTDPWL